MSDEIEIQPDTQPHQWPDGPVRELVLSLTHLQPLVELCVIRQHRVLRMVCQEQYHIGELSLDVVEMKSGGQNKITYEVEIELEQDGKFVEVFHCAFHG